MILIIEKISITSFEGVIEFHISTNLMNKGTFVIGLDNLNDN